jgi:hypothetical protein
MSRARPSSEGHDHLDPAAATEAIVCVSADSREPAEAETAA